MPRLYSADAYMRFVKCFKKIFKALNTHYISKLHNDANAKKAGRKMAMVFKKEYAEYFAPVSEYTNLLNGNAIGGITITADSSISSINYSYDIVASNRGIA